MSDNPQAARLHDNHLCPSHLGKDIVANTAPTILIEGHPAARITSQITCIGGPLDTVSIGEPTVLMCGLDAARRYDGTKHGGLITEGAPTVLIGSMSAMDKRMRLLARLMLIDKARQKAADMPDGPEKQALLDAANRLAENNRVVELARLAVKNDQIADVYDDTGAPEGWTRLGPDDLPPELGDAVFNDPDSGFYAAIFRNEIDGTYQLVYRGSEDQLNDWVNNGLQGTGNFSPQYEEAIRLAEQVAEVYGPGNVGVTGHSLGGGLASAAALATGMHATVFNPAGLSPETMDRIQNGYIDENGERQGGGALYGASPEQYIDVYQTEGEMLTWVQEQLAPRLAPYLPWDLTPPIPPGKKHPLEPYDYDEKWKIATPRPNPPPPGSILELDDFVKAWLDEAVHRHTNSIIGGIEKQKSDDIMTMMSGLGMAP